jgi:hypothetical protein
LNDTERTRTSVYADYDEDGDPDMYLVNYAGQTKHFRNDNNVSCPGSRLSVGEVGFLDARIDVTQGDNVLTLLCSFAEPSADGEIAAADVECWAF